MELAILANINLKELFIWNLLGNTLVALYSCLNASVLHMTQSIPSIPPHYTSKMWFSHDSSSSVVCTAIQNCTDVIIAQWQHARCRASFPSYVFLALCVRIYICVYICAYVCVSVQSHSCVMCV